MTSVKPPPPRIFRKPPLPRRRPRFSRLSLVVITSGILFALIVFAGIRLWTTSWVIRNPVSHEPVFTWHGSPGQKVILLMGVDEPNQKLHQREGNTFEGTRTDTMMLVRLNADKKRVAIVSIPRDSKVYLAGNHGIDKINAAHALGGPDLAVQTVQDSFGVPVDNFIVINLRGVREMVDALGGIDLYVEKPMHYVDHTAHLVINFEPGQHHLDGLQAEEFLRYRHDEMGDIGRIRRQQSFISAVAHQLREPGIVFKIPALVKVASQYVETDLSPNDLLTLAFFGKDINMNNIRTATLPGHPGGVKISYWIVDPQAAQMILDRLILDNPQQSFSVFSGPKNDHQPMRVGLYYNAALAPQLGQIIAHLQQQNFQVVCQSQQQHSGTQIIEHTSRVTDDWTDTLRNSDLRLANARLIFAPVGTTFERNACSTSEDYTIVLGADSQANTH